MLEHTDFAIHIVEGLSPACRPEGFATLYQALLRELVKGTPVSRQTLARVTGRSIEHVVGLLARAPNTEFDEDGNIVGYGITLRQTPHAFEVEGRRLYTWCALDALMFPALIGKTAQVQSRCAETGALVSLTAAPHQLRDVTPSGAAVSLVVPKADIRQSFCCHVHFFASGVAADRWVSRHPGMAAMGIEAAFMLGQEVAQRLISSSDQGIK